MLAADGGTRRCRGWCSFTWRSFAPSPKSCNSSPVAAAGLQFQNVEWSARMMRGRNNGLGGPRCGDGLRVFVQGYGVL